MRDKVKQSVYNKAYRESHKEHVLQLAKDYHAANREELLKGQKAYREANKDSINETKKKWLEVNKDYHKNYNKMKYATDASFKMKKNIKNLIGNSLRASGYKKHSRTEQILGCSYKELMDYLTPKFKSWMTWENKGLYNGQPDFGWDIDHITPLSSAKDEFELIKLHHYTNLQPLCSHYNRDIKRNNLL